MSSPWPGPPGWTNPVHLRPSAILTAVFVASAETSVVGASTLALAFNYTRGGAAGAFDWQCEISPYAVAANVPAGAAEWITEALYTPGLTAAGADTDSLVQRERQTYTATGAGAEDFLFGQINVMGVERIRVLARESGNIVNLGTLSIVGVLG
jgi:hypothetical protein